MSIRTILIFVLTLVFGGAAAILARNYLTFGNGPSAVVTVPVVVTAVEVPRGMKLVREHLTLRDWPKDHVPVGAFVTVEDVLNRVALGTLAQGDVLCLGKVSAPGRDSGLAGLVPAGMRGFHIQMPSFAAAIAGFVMPGNRVDILLTMNTPGGTKTASLLQNIEVMAVHHRLDTPKERPAMGEAEAMFVTVLVTPEQAQILELAQSKGALKLALRGSNDEKAAPPPRVVTERDIVGLAPDVPPDPPKVEEPKPEPVKEEPKKIKPLPGHLLTIVNGERITQTEFAAKPREDEEAPGTLKDPPKDAKDPPKDSKDSKDSKDPKEKQ